MSMMHANLRVPCKSISVVLGDKNLQNDINIHRYVREIKIDKMMITLDY